MSGCVSSVPTNAELLSVDLQDDPLSPEQLLVIADAPGLYRIDVVAPSADVPAGRYTLSIEAIRPATGVDAIRVGAMRKLEAGFRLRRAGEAASRRQALTELEAARSAFREVDDREGEARALVQIGLVSHYLGRPEGLDIARQALALCRALGNPLRLAEALNVIGQIQDRSGQGAQALESTARRSVSRSRRATPTRNRSFGSTSGRSTGGAAISNGPSTSYAER